MCKPLTQNTERDSAYSVIHTSYIIIMSILVTQHNVHIILHVFTYYVQSFYK